LLNRSNFLQLLEALDWKLMHEKDPVNKVRQLQNSGFFFSFLNPDLHETATETKILCHICYTAKDKTWNLITDNN
jgi:hypothetical protein